MTRSGWMLGLKQALDRDELIDTARGLIRCPSVNPSGDESEAAEYVASLLRELGARDVQLVEAAPRRVSVLARWGTPGGRVLAWNGHTDVVPVGNESDWNHAPFAGEVAEGRLWGRGAVDMKGAVACAIQAVAMIRRANLELDGEVFFQIVADEETGGALGAEYLARRGDLSGADAAICGEATQLDAYVAAKGLLWLRITVHGQSCHASQPHLGQSAIASMRHVLAALEEMELPDLGHRVLPGPTIVPTVITGGTKPNVVPDTCSLVVDRRMLPGETREGVRAQVQELLDRLRVEHGVEADVEEEMFYEPAEIDPGSDIVRAVQAATAAAIGREAQIGGSSGATDARFLINQCDTPTVIFGPGRISEAHTIDEWVEVEQLELASLAYAATMCEFLGVRESPS